jgi:hypothetical protein
MFLSGIVDMTPDKVTPASVTLVDETVLTLGAIADVFGANRTIVRITVAKHILIITEAYESGFHLNRSSGKVTTFK